MLGVPAWHATSPAHLLEGFVCVCVYIYIYVYTYICLYVYIYNLSRECGEGGGWYDLWGSKGPSATMLSGSMIPGSDA